LFGHEHKDKGDLVKQNMVMEIAGNRHHPHHHHSGLVSTSQIRSADIT